MKLGPIELPTDLLLAPMMDITTPSFRQLIYSLGGVGMVVTPMVFVQQIAQAPKTVVPQLENLEKQRPCALQLVASGKNIDMIKEAIDFISPYEFDMIDINGGCPAPHTMKSGGGGALLKEYDREGSIDRMQVIIDTCIKYSPKPVSLKTRLGFNDSEDIIEIAKMVENSGIAFLTIHGRTVSQKYGGSVDLEKIRQLKEAINLPIVGNGDVHDYASYKQMKEITGCDAVMIGRAASFDPAIFARIWAQEKAAEKNEPLPLFPKYMDLETIRRYLRQDEEFIMSSSRFWRSERFILAELRRLGIWFIKGLPGYKKIRMRLSRMSTLAELHDYVFGSEIEQDLTASF